jgi:hypothetical protein
MGFCATEQEQIESQRKGLAQATRNPRNHRDAMSTENKAKFAAVAEDSRSPTFL